MDDQKRKELVERIRVADTEKVAAYIIELQEKCDNLEKAQSDASWNESQREPVSDSYGNHLGWR